MITVEMGVICASVEQIQHKRLFWEVLLGASARLLEDPLFHGLAVAGEEANLDSLTRL